MLIKFMEGIELIKLEIYDPKTKETKVHKVDFVSTRWLMKALEIQAKTYNSEFEQVTALIEFVSSLFNITVDEILDGTSSNEITETLENILFDVMGIDEKKRQAIREQNI